jgi:hypothetical protein
MVTYRHIWMLLNVIEFLWEGDTPSNPRMQGRSKLSPYWRCAGYRNLSFRDLEIFTLKVL